MKSFTYERARSPAEAAAAAARTQGAKFIAGGTNLLDLMKLEIETPAHLIDVNGLALDKIEATPDGGLRIGALVRARQGDWRAQTGPLVAYLRQQQFTEQNGWRPQDPAYGAWGMGGVPRTPPNTGHVDLSMTRHVLEALRAGKRQVESIVMLQTAHVERLKAVLELAREKLGFQSGVLAVAD